MFLISTSRFFSTCFPRFRTNSDVLPGVERIAIMKPEQQMLESDFKPCPKLEPQGLSKKPNPSESFTIVWFLQVTWWYLSAWPTSKGGADQVHCCAFWLGSWS